MRRIALLIAGLYGVSLSYTAGRTLRDVRRRTLEGDDDARGHFTQTKYARFFGVPNSDLGVLYYGAVTIVVALSLSNRGTAHRLVRFGSVVSLLRSAYLLWALKFRLHVWCPVCMKGHALNLVTWHLLRSDKFD